MSEEQQGSLLIDAFGRQAEKHAPKGRGPQLGALGKVLIAHMIAAEPHKPPVQILQELHKKLVDAHRGALEQQKGARR